MKKHPFSENILDEKKQNKTKFIYLLKGRFQINNNENLTKRWKLTQVYNFIAFLNFLLASLDPMIFPSEWKYLLKIKILKVL